MRLPSNAAWSKPSIMVFLSQEEHYTNVHTHTSQICTPLCLRTLYQSLIQSQCNKSTISHYQWCTANEISSTHSWWHHIWSYRVWIHIADGDSEVMQIHPSCSILYSLFSLKLIIDSLVLFLFVTHNCRSTEVYIFFCIWNSCINTYMLRLCKCTVFLLWCGLYVIGKCNSISCEV